MNPSCLLKCPSIYQTTSHNATNLSEVTFRSPYFRPFCWAVCGAHRAISNCYYP